jgi:hypothetical protein
MVPHDIADGDQPGTGHGAEDALRRPARGLRHVQMHEQEITTRQRGQVPHLEAGRCRAMGVWRRPRHRDPA